MYRTIAFDDEDVIETPSAVATVTGTQTFDFSSDGGATLDADVYGPAEVKYSLSGYVGWRADGPLTGDYEGSAPMNQVQWGNGIARALFAWAARGVQEATLVTRRDAVDANAATIGDAVVADIAHVPNAQLGQTPTSQRGGDRWWRVIQRKESPEGAELVLADANTGVAYGSSVILAVVPDLYDPQYFVGVEIYGSTALEADGAWLELEVALGDSAPTTNGVRYTILDGRHFTDASSLVVDPFTERLGPFPSGATVWVRARGFLIGGAPGAWSAWASFGGSPIPTPPNDIANLVISNVTDNGAILTWTNSDITNQVRVQYRLNNTGSWTTFSTEAIGTTTKTITGLAAGSLYGVRVVLWTGVTETGTAQTGRFHTLSGALSSLIIGTPAGGSVQLSWTNTNTTDWVKVETKVAGGSYTLAAFLRGGSDRHMLYGLAPTTAYTVRVVLLSANGTEFGNVLSGSFTTAAASVTLAPPTSIRAFAGYDPSTSALRPGYYGAQIVSGIGNPPHLIVVEEAVETSVGSGTPGSYSVVAVLTSVQGGGYTIYGNTAPNDGKLRYMRAYSRQQGYTSSSTTSAVSIDPWTSTAPSTVDPHAATHEDGGTDEIDVTGLSGLLADAQKVTVRKNSGVNVGTRQRLNLIEGSNVTLTVTDDGPNNEVDVTIAASSSSGLVVRKNTGADVGTRPRLNFIEGANVSLTVNDDAGDSEIDITIAASTVTVASVGYFFLGRYT